MPYGTQSARRLSALKIVDAAAWFREVREAIEKHRTVPEAAKELDVGVRTLWRWIEEMPSLTRGLNLPHAGGGSHRQKLWERKE